MSTQTKTNVKNQTVKSQIVPFAEEEVQEDEQPTIRIAGVVTSISDEIKIKKGSGRPYALCQVEFTEGIFEGDIVYAQRTLGEDSKGREKTNVTVGQKVSCIPNKVIDPVTGETKLFWEISTGAPVTDVNELLDKLGW